jgi:hypothetical protein
MIERRKEKKDSPPWLLINQPIPSETHVIGDPSSSVPQARVDCGLHGRWGAVGRNVPEFVSNPKGLVQQSEVTHSIRLSPRRKKEGADRFH